MRALEGPLGDYLATHRDLSVISRSGRLAVFSGWDHKPADELPKLIGDAAGLFRACGIGD
jgi:hypothetical protein